MNIHKHAQCLIDRLIRIGIYSQRNPWDLSFASDTPLSSASYRLFGTLEQPDAGGPMRSSTFELTGGFWAAVSASPCTGDLDADRDVDLTDLSTLLSHFGTTSGAAWQDGDSDVDGDVDLADLSALLSAFGGSC